MTLIDVFIPALGESISEGTITAWRIQPGQAVAVDQPLLELETDKVTAEIPSPVAGVLHEALYPQGADVKVGAVVARIALDATPSAVLTGAAVPVTAVAPFAGKNEVLPPASRRAAEELGVDPKRIEGTGRRGQVRKEDVFRAAARAAEAPSIGTATLAMIPIDPGAGVRPSRRVPMTRMRRRIAERLKEVQNTAAILTTFNEVDMSGVMAMRTRHGEAFLKAHGVKLGFMSFFVKAAVEALKSFPALNASVDGDDVIYNDFFDIGVAVSTEKGLVVPVLRDSDRLSFAEVEKSISELGKAARDSSLTLDQLTGGTFSITNGGVFGSMLSTPILNPPQSGILGMHSIQNRPVAVGDRVEIRPIMYVALSYDHRIVDGSQAVSFLVKIKQIVEDPARLLLEL